MMMMKVAMMIMRTMIKLMMMIKDVARYDGFS